jgi:ribosomal protein L15
MRKLLVILVALVATGPALSSCSGNDSGSGGSGGSGNTGKSTTIDITIKGDNVTPHGDRVKAKVNTPITLKIKADKAGQIHVHSTPEQHIDFPKGESTKKLTIKQPGIVDVEDHALDKVIVQLQVQ